MRLVRSFFFFYLGFLPAGWSLTLICLFIFHILYPDYGWNTFIYLFWFKVTTLGLTWYVLDRYKKQVYYYYFNLGLSKTLLWAVTLGLDFGLYIFLFIITAPRQ